jgi:hypothetical protein
MSVIRVAPCEQFHWRAHVLSVAASSLGAENKHRSHSNRIYHTSALLLLLLRGSDVPMKTARVAEFPRAGRSSTILLTFEAT